MVKQAPGYITKIEIVRKKREQTGSPTFVVRRRREKGDACGDFNDDEKNPI